MWGEEYVHFGDHYVYTMTQFPGEERLERHGMIWYPRTKDLVIRGRGIVQPKSLTMKEYLEAIQVKRTAELLGLI